MKTATRVELLQVLEKRSEAINTLSGTIVLDASGGALKTGVLTEYRQTKGFVIVDRPNHIRMKAQAPFALATVFDMVSDGREYRVSMPLSNKFFVGDTQAPAKAANPMLNLRPQHILSALFVDVRPYLNKPNIYTAFEETVVGQNSYYVFQFFDAKYTHAQLIEKIWVDRSELEISRKQIFALDGKVETDVQYLDYHDHEGIQFPDTINIQRPLEDYALKMTFQNMDLNQQLAADSFQLERPSGSDLVQSEQ